jgi:PTS system nitrogen regulatory IIA component
MPTMDIYKILRERSCTVKLSARSKTECLQRLAHLISLSVKNISEQDLYQALLERESLGSTGFEDGIAIPHAKLKNLPEFILAIAVSRKGIPFESLDNKRSQLFFTVVGPDERAEEHLQILAQISRISRNHHARRELMHADSPLALKEAFIRYTTEIVHPQTSEEKHRLITIVLYEMRYFEDVIDLFVERGIRGVNVMESAGIKDVLSNIPLFSDFLNFLGERPEISKTLMAVVPDSFVTGIIEGLEEIIGDLNTHTGAMVMVQDLIFMKGSLEV